MAKRVVLTKKHQETPEGKQLLELCRGISEDGKLSVDEIRALAKWLSANRKSTLPAVAFLHETLSRILADRTVTKSEMAELHEAIEKVLPAADRKVAATSRRASEAPAAFCPYCKAPLDKVPKGNGTCHRCGEKFSVHDGRVVTREEKKQLSLEHHYQRQLESIGGRADAPAEGQLALMWRLGVNVPVGCTDKQASQILDQYNDILDEGPTEEERQEWSRLRYLIRDRIKRGETIDEIIASPPASVRKTSNVGCLASCGKLLSVVGCCDVIPFWK